MGKRRNIVFQTSVVGHVYNPSLLSRQRQKDLQFKASPGKVSKSPPQKRNQKLWVWLKRKKSTRTLGSTPRTKGGEEVTFHISEEL
jgi:hypothetical protein